MRAAHRRPRGGADGRRTDHWGASDHQRGNGRPDDGGAVDSVDLASGQVTVVLAAVEQEQGGSGSYGKVGTTDGALPPDVLAEPAEPSDQPTGEGESSP